jgi:hypothetical protein
VLAGHREWEAARSTVIGDRTVAVPDSAVVSRPSRGDAELFVEDLRLFDMHEITNALTRNTGDAAVVSFDVRWGGEDGPVHVHDETLGLDAAFVAGNASIRWVGTNLTTGFPFESDVAGQAVGGAAAYVGRERNGDFFHQHDARRAQPRCAATLPMHHPGGAQGEPCSSRSSTVSAHGPRAARPRPCTAG